MRLLLLISGNFSKDVIILEISYSPMYDNHVIIRGPSNKRLGAELNIYQILIANKEEIQDLGTGNDQHPATPR